MSAETLETRHPNQNYDSVWRCGIFYEGWVIHLSQDWLIWGWFCTSLSLRYEGGDNRKGIVMKIARMCLCHESVSHKSNSWGIIMVQIEELPSLLGIIVLASSANIISITPTIVTGMMGQASNATMGHKLGFRSIHWVKTDMKNKFRSLPSHVHVAGNTSVC